MLLLVDIGNTYTKIKLENDSRIFHIETSKIQDLTTLNSLFPAELSFDKACISSVSIGKELIFKEYFNQRNIKSLIVDKDLKFNIKYPSINELGSDLMCLMEGCSLMDKSFIAISLGTASVFLYVENNIFMGCAIAPGLLSSLDGLINTASMIENTSLGGDYDLLGMNTIDSLRDGVLQGHTFMVDGYIKAIKDKYNNTKLKTYMIGGFSDVISKNINHELTINQELIFNGMINIYKNNEGNIK